MSGVRGSSGTGFKPELTPGSPEHVYALNRRRWRAAFEAWIAANRPDYLELEPTLWEPAP